MILQSSCLYTRLHCHTHILLGTHDSGQYSFCSAGVGRTGTFMTLHAQLKRMERENNIDIFGYVRSMRYNRNCMVQTEVRCRCHSHFFVVATVHNIILAVYHTLH